MPTQLPLEVEEWIYTHRTPTSALLASSVATLIGFPLDSVKSRLQVSKYHGFMDCVRKTYKHEGVQGFFRGLTMPLLTITLVRTVSFSIYDATKKKLAKPGSSVFDPSTFTGRAALGFAGGATSGLLLSAGTCAFELVKVRSQLEYLISKRRGVPYQPKGTFSGASLIWRENGLRGLYFGYSLHTLRDTLGTSFYFMLYDSTRYLLADPRYGSYIPTTLAPFLCGSTCGILSWFLVYPIDLVKTRVQRDALSGIEDRESATQIFKRLRQKGIARLYRGLGVSATRSAITHGVLWLLLESFQARIEKRYTELPSIEEERLV